MNYFLSDVHGASKAYFEMKEKIGFRNNDELYIIGDIFDGNDQNPGACIEILNDIMTNDNIHLILGDHEYAHVMYQLSLGQDDNYLEWEKYITSDSFEGTSLLKYFENNLSEKERNRYLEYLISCEMTELVKIGKNYFYLVHGAPSVCRNRDICNWQRDVVMTRLLLNHNYAIAIASNPDLEIPKEAGNAIVIAGHIPVRCYFDESDRLFTKYYGEEKEEKHQKIIVENRKILLNCECDGNNIGNTVNGWVSDLACIGIDAAGYFVEYLIGDSRYPID